MLKKPHIWFSKAQWYCGFPDVIFYGVGGSPLEAFDDAKAVSSIVRMFR